MSGLWIVLAALVVGSAPDLADGLAPAPPPAKVVLDKTAFAKAQLAELQAMPDSVHCVGWADCPGIAATALYNPTVLAVDRDTQPDGVHWSVSFYSDKNAGFWEARFVTRDGKRVGQASLVKPGFSL